MLATDVVSRVIGSSLICARYGVGIIQKNEHNFLVSLVVEQIGCGVEQRRWKRRGRKKEEAPRIYGAYNYMVSKQASTVSLDRPT